MESPLPFSSESLDLSSFRSELNKLSDALRNSREEPELSASDTDQFLKCYTMQCEAEYDRLVQETLDVGMDVDAFGACLKHAIKGWEAAGSRVSDEIEALKTDLEYSNEWESNNERLQHSLDFIELKGVEKAKGGGGFDCSFTPKELPIDFIKAQDKKIEFLKDNFQNEEIKEVLNTVQDMECMDKKFEAFEEILNAVTDLKIIKYEGNCIKLTLRTTIPILEDIYLEPKSDDVVMPSEVNHELLIEVMNDSLEPKTVEILPNDVYIGGVFDAAKSLGSIVSHMSSLEWFVTKVQFVIILSTLRQYVVKASNNTRRSNLFEYLDSEEMIVVHMRGGVDGTIKLPHGWPLWISSLSLVSLKNSDFQSKFISQNVSSEVKEAANSLDSEIRGNLLSFAAAIDEILLRQIGSAIHSGD